MSATDAVPEEHDKPASIGNRFGVAEAVFGFLAGELIAAVVSVFADVAAGHTTSFGSTLGGLLGLWIGLAGAAIVTSLKMHRGSRERIRALLVADYGFRFKLIDLPVGIAVGLVSALALVPLLELPLEPFVSHLNERLGARAIALTNHVNGWGYVILGLFVCVGSPIVEELFFRGLLLRGLIGRLEPVLRNKAAVAVSLVIDGVLFGLAHFAAIELLALCCFGIVLGVLAVRTRRLGPGIVAHATFNTVTIISLARTH